MTPDVDRLAPEITRWRTTLATAGEGARAALQRVDAEIDALTWPEDRELVRDELRRDIQRAEQLAHEVAFSRRHER